MKMTLFKWKNTMAEIYISNHTYQLRDYLTDIVLPSIDALEAKIREHSESKSPASAFAQNDAEDLLLISKRAFALAIHSIWEKQFRSYLETAGKELLGKEKLGLRARSRKWLSVEKLFLELRGLKFESFPSYWDLETLRHVGNACRHGAGPSAEWLTTNRPDFWPFQHEDALLGGKYDAEYLIEAMDVTKMHLEEFVDAIADFWETIGYIYLVSLDRKHDNVVREIRKFESEGRWYPIAT